MKAVALGALLSVAAFAPVAGALDVSEFSNYLAGEVARTDEALNSSPDALGGGWTVNNFYLRLHALIGFEIPAIANLTIVPQIELVWHRVR